MDASEPPAPSSPAAAPRPPPPPRDARPNVYLYGLTDKVDDRHLDDIFGHYGRITRLRVRRGTWPPDPDTLRRSAILEYECFEDAEKAVEHMDHGQIDGVYIRATLQEDAALAGDRRVPSPRHAWGRGADTEPRAPRAWGTPRDDAPRMPPRDAPARSERDPFERDALDPRDL